MKKKEYLKYITKLNKDDYISHDSINEINIKNIFLPYINVNNLLIEKFSVETFIKQSEINYLGVIKSFDVFIKKMLLRRSGTVLIMSSIAGWIGLPKASAYAPTKSALRSFAQSIRYDLAKYNIVVKLCSPGFVNTKAVKVNDFKMPGLIEPNVAAKIILKNLKNNNNFIKNLKNIKNLLEKEKNWTNMFAVFGGLACLTDNQTEQIPENVKALD